VTNVPTLASVVKIKDPLLRATRAAEIVHDAQERAEATRNARDLAALHLERVQHWRPVDIVDLIGVSRGLFVRIRQRGPAHLPVIDNAEDVARTMGEETIKWDTLAKQAGLVRDNAIYEARQAGISNADLHRATGLTTARIAQLKHGPQV